MKKVFQVFFKVFTAVWPILLWSVRKVKLHIHRKEDIVMTDKQRLLKVNQVTHRVTSTSTTILVEKGVTDDSKSDCVPEPKGNAKVESSS